MKKEIRIAPKKFEDYAKKHSVLESLLFKKLVRETFKRTNMPIMQVGHLEGAFLRLLVKIAKARRILEIGTFTGYSALAMAEGLPKNGRLITLDCDPRAVKIAKSFWKQSPHGRKIRPIVGIALESLQKIKGNFDLVFIDADKSNYANYWEWVVAHTRKGGLIIVDNVLWSLGNVFKPKSETDRAITAFNQKVKKDKRVEAVMLTVRDGMTLAFKK